MTESIIIYDWPLRRQKESERTAERFLFESCNLQFKCDLLIIVKMKNFEDFLTLKPKKRSILRGLLQAKLAKLEH